MTVKLLLICYSKIIVDSYTKPPKINEKIILLVFFDLRLPFF